MTFTAWQLCLGIFLILFALSLLVTAIPKAILAILAGVAGILVLVGR